MGIENLLRRWELFSHFSDSQLERLAACSSALRYPAGAVIVKEGEPTRDLYLLQGGGVRIRRKTRFGPFILAELGAGNLFGEASFIDQAPRSGDAVTLGETEMFTLDALALTAALEADAGFKLALYWAFWRSLSGKLRQTNENLTRFFSETGRPAGTEAAPKPPEAGGFRVDLASKRRLFQEQKLSNMEINFLSSLSRERKFGPSEIIFRDGDPGNEMFVVLEGRVMISKYIPGAGEEALAFLDRGDYFGEMALIDNEPRSADAKASEEGAVALVISRDVLSGILDIHKVSSIRLLTILCQLVAGRLRELDEKIIGWFHLSGGSGISWPLRAKG